MTNEIVFATASPRRKELAYKIKYITRDIAAAEPPSKLYYPVFMPADVEEVCCGSCKETAIKNARLKGEYIRARTDKPVLAFDTVAGTSDDRTFGKPKTREQAIDMFKALCGDTHVVITAVYLDVNGKIIEKYGKTYVEFDTFDENLVYNYVDSGAPYDKAGGYNIDDAAIKPLIKGIRGDYYNVVGLPIELTEELIEENLIYGKAGHSD